MIVAAEQLRDLIDLSVLLSLPGVLVLAWLVGRLLGVRRSWTTTLLSGVIGWVGGVALSLAIASQRKDMSEGFTRNVWLFSTLGVMSASVWIELLAKPGTLARAQTGLTSIPHPIKAVKRRGRRVSRYAQISRIAIRNGLGPSLGLDVLNRLATVVEQRTTWGAEYRVCDLADEFAERLREELDFEIEARNASDIAANLNEGRDVRIPAVFHDLTTRRVLVMEWLDGVSVRDTDAIDELRAART